VRQKDSSKPGCAKPMVSAGSYSTPGSIGVDNSLVREDQKEQIQEICRQTLEELMADLKKRLKRD